MSHALYYDWTQTAEDAAVRFRPRPRTTALQVSLVAAVIAMALSGSAVAWRWSQFADLDTEMNAYMSPVQVSLPPEDFADAQVIHGRLEVLPPPAYANVAVPTAGQVQSPDLVQALEASAPETPAAEVATPDESEADTAAPMVDESVSADPLPYDAPVTEDRSF
jgi:hypothetical protein